MYISVNVHMFAYVHTYTSYVHTDIGDITPARKEADTLVSRSRGTTARPSRKPAFTPIGHTPLEVVT